VIFLRIISIEMKAPALVPEGGAFHDQVRNGDHVSKFAQLWRYNGAYI